MRIKTKLYIFRKFLFRIIETVNKWSELHLNRFLLAQYLNILILLVNIFGTYCLKIKVNIYKLN